jgi:hypothetical protein
MPVVATAASTETHQPGVIRSSELHLGLLLTWTQGTILGR